MHGVGAKSGLVPEKHLCALCLCSTGNGRIGFALPLLDGLRVTLIGALQRLLRSQSELGQQRTDRRHPQFHAELLLDARQQRAVPLRICTRRLRECNLSCAGLQSVWSPNIGSICLPLPRMRQNGSPLSLII